MVEHQPQAGGPAKQGSLHILIIEDQRDNAESLALILRLRGHTVQIAGDGPTALRLAENDEPDVVFVDIGLPGMSGWEVAERIHRHAWRKMPLLIALTGYGQEKDRRRSGESGIHIHLVKPVDPVELETILRRFQGTL